MELADAVSPDNYRTKLSPASIRLSRGIETDAQSIDASIAHYKAGNYPGSHNESGIVLEYLNIQREETHHLKPLQVPLGQELQEYFAKKGYSNLLTQAVGLWADSFTSSPDPVSSHVLHAINSRTFLHDTNERLGGSSGLISEALIFRDSPFAKFLREKAGTEGIDIIYFTSQDSGKLSHSLRIICGDISIELADRNGQEHLSVNALGNTELESSVTSQLELTPEFDFTPPHKMLQGLMTLNAHLLRAEDTKLEGSIIHLTPQLNTAHFIVREKVEDLVEQQMYDFKMSPK